MVIQNVIEEKNNTYTNFVVVSSTYKGLPHKSKQQQQKHSKS